jgi:hypothetical protein
MEVTKQTYVVLAIPDGLYARTQHFKVDSRNPYAIPTPGEVFAIQFYDMYSTFYEVDGSALELKSHFVNPSKLYYIRGKLFHILEFGTEYPKRIDVVRRLEEAGHKQLIKFGKDIFPFEPDVQEYLKDYVNRTDDGRKPETEDVRQAAG